MTEQIESPWAVEFRDDKSALLDRTVVTSQPDAWIAIQRQLPGIRARYSGPITVLAMSQQGDTYRGICEVDGSFAWEPAHDAPSSSSPNPGDPL